ncbi:MAG: DUF2461 domain-containing protein [Pseudomonadota bacterium]
MAQGFDNRSLSLLSELAANNNRDWFHAHKDDIKARVQEPFADLLEALTNRLSDAAVPLIGGPKTMFRMQRDVRFSKDKTPYKPSVSGMLTRSGAKAEMGGVLYLVVDPLGGMMGAGWYMLAPKELAPLRQAIVTGKADVDALMADLNARGRCLSDHNSLTNLPRGFSAHADHPHAHILKMKSLLMRADLTPQDWISGDVVDHAQQFALDAMPLLRFGREHLGKVS